MKYKIVKTTFNRVRIGGIYWIDKNTNADARKKTAVGKFRFVRYDLEYYQGGWDGVFIRVRARKQ